MVKKGRPKSRPGLVHEDYPSGLLRIAKDRTWTHMSLMRYVDYKLPQLLVNVYCQGVRDTAEALANNPQHLREMLPKTEPSIWEQVV